MVHPLRLENRTRIMVGPKPDLRTLAVDLRLPNLISWEVLGRRLHSLLTDLRRVALNLNPVRDLRRVLRILAPKDLRDLRLGLHSLIPMTHRRGIRNRFPIPSRRRLLILGVTDHLWDLDIRVTSHKGEE